MSTRIKIRRDTAANWTAANPTLAAGEIGFETDTYKIKIGTGALAWNARGYFAAAPSGAAGGDLSGTYPNPTVANINGNPLGSTTPTDKNVLIANGTSWITRAVSGDVTIGNTGVVTLANSGVSASTYGSATQVPVFAVDAKGRVTSVTNTTISGSAPGGSAGGDLSGTYPNPAVAKINGATLGSTTATDKNILIADGSSWVTRALSGDATISNTGALSISAAAQRNIARQAIYKPFTVGASDDEFDDASFTGWTAVNDGTAVPTVTEDNDCASILVPTGSTAVHLYAYMKTVTVNTNDIIEICFRGFGLNASFNIAGLIMADGTTYGAGSQITWYLSPSEATQLRRNAFTNYNTQVGATGFGITGQQPFGDVFLRLKYEGSNNWSGYASPDGISWNNLTGTFARTLTPTAVGFFVTQWGAASSFVWSFRYFRKL